MKPFPSYPKIRTLGHPEIDKLFYGYVQATEKVDGSQFTFGKVGGGFKAMSKRVAVNADNLPKMFEAAYWHAHKLYEQGLLPQDIVFRGEVLSKPKHNVLKYDRVPNGNFILFDVMEGPERYMYHSRISEWGKRLGYEVVPLLYEGTVSDIDKILELLDTESILGGQKIEGIVFKNYRVFNEYTGKPLMGKYVRPEFKEQHAEMSKGGGYGNAKTTPRELGMAFSTEPRWNKAIQRLRDEGRLTNSPKDIGPIIAEVQQDIEEEAKEAIKERLWRMYRRDIMTGAVRQIPQWYKQHLLSQQEFDNE